MYYKNYYYYWRLLKSFIGPDRQTRLLFNHHLHLRLFLPFHFLLLFSPCLFCIHLLRLLTVGQFFVNGDDLLIGGPTAAIFLLRHQVIVDVVGIENDTFQDLAHLEEGPTDLGVLRE